MFPKKNGSTGLALFIILACVLPLAFNACGKSSSPLQEYADYCLYVLGQIQTVSCTLELTTEAEQAGSGGQAVPFSTETLLYEAVPDKLHLESAQTSGNSPSSKYVMICDGTYQWSEYPVAAKNTRECGKIRLAGITTPERPFDTGMRLNGTGLQFGEGLLGTVRFFFRCYRFKEVYTAQVDGVDCIVLEGKVKQDEFVNYFAESRQMFKRKDIDSFADKMAFARLYFAESDYFIRRYETGPAFDSNYMEVSITGLSLNAGMPPGIFTYAPPAGVNVQDITEGLKKALTEYKRTVK